MFKKVNLIEIEKNCGLNYEHKNSRIKSYISYYQSKMQSGELIGYTQKDKDAEAQKILQNIIHNGQTPNGDYLSMKKRLSIALATKYISTLNDSEFIQLLQDTNIITEEQKASLTRKYRDIDNLQNERYIHEKWKKIQKEQSDASKIVE